jgi:hypothetical protein
VFSGIWGFMLFFVSDLISPICGFGAPVLCFPACGARAFRLWGTFGFVVVSSSVASGSGRIALDQGSFFPFFGVVALAPKMVTWILTKHTKTNGFRAIYAPRAVRRNRRQWGSFFRRQQV